MGSGVKKTPRLSDGPKLPKLTAPAAAADAPTTAASAVAAPVSEPAVVSSRLCVKGLPISMTEKKLRDVFAAFNDSVTDAKIMKTQNGQTRKFGFVGFRSPEAAAAARKYFDQSFIETSRITVETALPTGSSSLPRPWSKYSSGSSANPETVKAKEAKDAEMEEKRREREKAKKANVDKLVPELVGLTPEQITKLQKDPKFAAFMNAMKPRKKTKFWEDDDLRTADAVATSTLQAQQTSKKGAKAKGEEDSSSEDDEETFANPSIDEARIVVQDKKPAEDKKMSDLEYLKLKQSANFDDDSDVVSEKEEETEASKGEARTGGRGGDKEEIENDEDDDDEGDEDTTGDSSAKRAKQSVTTKVVASSSGSSSKPIPPSNGDGHGFKPGVREEADTIGETGRLFLRNLAFSATVDDLTALFIPFGALAEVKIPLDSTKRPKGIGFVSFVNPGCAVRAYQELDKTSFQGRLLHIIPSRAKPTDDNDLSLESMTDDMKDSLTYKKKKDLKLKAASQNDDTWNTLFIRSGTVADSIAAKYGVKKSELMDTEAGNLAVRLSLAETQLIKETREFLKEQGVSLEAFEGKKSTCERSRTIILVKNIPFETEVDELKRLFGKFGHLRRVCLPPAKTMAIVEYVERTEAEKGFTGLAFKKFKHVPLYLEWAPKNVFVSTPTTSAAVGAGPKTEESTEASLDEVGETGTLFVKNLNFDTTAATLKKVFETVGPTRTATIARKKDPKIPGAYLSMGYGFVEYVNKADCVAAAKTLQGREIDGHAIQLKISNRSSSEGVKSTRGKAPAVGDNTNAPCTKIIVKNLAFEATKKELRELFGTFGQVKSCRIPRKFDGTHRGFGFVDFLTKQEAKNAFEALQSSHLYGRHLVLKWATEEDSLEEIRKKTQDRFGESVVETTNAPPAASVAVPKNKKRKAG